MTKWLGGLISSRKVVFFIAKFNKEDMLVLRELLETGKVKPAIDRRYELSEIADALEYMGEGHCRRRSSSPCEVRRWSYWPSPRSYHVGTRKGSETPSWSN